MNTILLIAIICLIVYGFYWLGQNQEKIIEMRDAQREKIKQMGRDKKF